MKSIKINTQSNSPGRWQGPLESIQDQEGAVRSLLRQIDRELFFLRNGSQLGVTDQGHITPGDTPAGDFQVLARARPLTPDLLGNPGFRKTHGVKSAYMAGSMANAISSEEFVISMGKAGYLASFGAGGVPPTRLKEAIEIIQNELPEGPYAFNLIHSPNEPAMEQLAVDLYLKHGVRTVEASAFLRLTPPLVEYRAAGLSPDASGKPEIKNKIIAKLSRREVAQQFLNPAPEKILQQLVGEGKISPRQAELAGQVPMADDITVEADSGGHTDNRPLISLLPSLQALRDEIQQQQNYPIPVRVGAAGGIGTPTSVLGAFSMGADYVVTGSVNQSCREAGTSEKVKQLLADAAATDMMMAPSADMFEMGVKVQVLKRGTMFPMRAQKLYDLYQEVNSIEGLDPDTQNELEEKIFQKKLEDVWSECVSFFQERDPEQLEKARKDPKKKMALIYRWYLGLATYWGIQGTPERAFDYQIWCGPAMGAFNDWTAGTYLASPENRRAVEVADQLMTGAAYLYRLFDLKLQGVHLPPNWNSLLS
ncbi:MAG: PfaD family polyunsaturated fatty acid/polyketide biosynthesis protein [Anaerolineales bacterium]|nr:PfaD family polyunsaturated fatty acid/polyketide biosynthesis protein [Anaerolineales bacterium]